MQLFINAVDGELTRLEVTPEITVGEIKVSTTFFIIVAIFLKCLTFITG